MAIDEFDRGLSQALLASIAAGACSLAFFDTFAFPQSAGCIFLILGMAGAMRRLTLAEARTDEVGHVEVPVAASAALTLNGEHMTPKTASGEARERPADRSGDLAG